MLSFKSAEILDLDGLINIYHPNSSEKREQLRKLQEKRINFGNELGNEFIIASDGNNFIGHVIVEGNKMKALYVEESNRNQGLGTLIIEEVEKRLKSRGFKMVEISVNPDENEKAKRLYQRLGYRVKSDKKCLEYVDPYDGAEDWVIDLFKEI